MIDNSKEYILCAAYKRIEEKDCPQVYNRKYHDIYHVELGWRHPDILHKFQGEVNKSPVSAGFLTSRCRWVSREEAMDIALACGQVKEGETYHRRHLFSEDLY